MRLIDSLRRRIAPTTEEEEASPVGWRERVLSTILAVVVALGTLTAIPSVWLAWRDGQLATIAVDLVALAIAFFLAFHPRLSFRLRAATLLIVTYLLGVWFLLTIGLVSQLYLMAVPILTALLLGLRPALCALVLNTITLGVIGYLTAADVPAGEWDTNPALKWTLVSLNFLFVDAVITISSAVLLRRLERSLAREQRSAESLERMGRAIEQSRDGILISDLGGRVVYANGASRLLTAGDHADAHVIRMQELAGNEVDADALDTALATGREWSGVVTLVDAQRARRVVETTVTPLRDDRGTVRNFVAVLHDATHERTMEDRLRQGQKLEALGTLAGGIAHDFNNIIGSILAVSEMEREDAAERDDTTAMDQIIVACHRARDIVRKMMAFSRTSAQTRAPVVLAAVIEEALPLLRAAIPASIQFRSELRSRGMVAADPVEIHQILMNLATNAAHAMAGMGGGTLRFTLTEVVTVDGFTAPRDGVGLRPGARYLALEVADTGHGISQEHLDRIFDPFFTTKHPSEGTGLGLASVHGIVRSLDGEIEVTTETGSGTTFRILLPVASEVVVGSPADEEIELPSVELDGWGVLVVDDEPTLREAQRMALEREGYTVTSAADGREAQRILAEGKLRVDLLITDFSMPGVNGLQLIRAARVSHPEMKVILTSGYGSAIEQRELEELQVDAFLHKPYGRAALLRTAREVLAGIAV